MNINITQIVNGFIVAIQLPQGQSAQYFPTFNSVVQYLSTIPTVSSEPTAGFSDSRPEKN